MEGERRKDGIVDDRRTPPSTSGMGRRPVLRTALEQIPATRKTLGHAFNDLNGLESAPEAILDFMGHEPAQAAAGISHSLVIDPVEGEELVVATRRAVGRDGARICVPFGRRQGTGS